MLGGQLAEPTNVSILLLNLYLVTPCTPQPLHLLQQVKYFLERWSHYRFLKISYLFCFLSSMICKLLSLISLKLYRYIQKFSFDNHQGSPWLNWPPQLWRTSIRAQLHGPFTGNILEKEERNYLRGINKRSDDIWQRSLPKIDN